VADREKVIDVELVNRIEGHGRGSLSIESILHGLLQIMADFIGTRSNS